MRVLYLICACGRDAKIAWPMERTTLRAKILPRTRCSRCGQQAADMRIIWEPPEVYPMDGSLGPSCLRNYSASLPFFGQRSEEIP